MLRISSSKNIISTTNNL